MRSFYLREYSEIYSRMKTTDIKIGTQLQIGFGLILLLIILVGVFSLNQTDKIAQQSIGIYQHPLQVQRALGQLNIDILSMRLEFADFLLATGDPYREKSIKSIESSHISAEQQFTILTDRYLGPKQDIADAQIAFEQWFTKLEDLRDFDPKALNAGSIYQLQMSDDFKKRPELLLKTIKKMDDFAKAKGEELFQNAIQLDQTLHWQMVMFVIGIFAFSMIIVFNLVRNIRHPLKQISAATKLFRDGKTQTRSNYLNDNEFGMLSTAFNDLADTIETELALNKQSSKLAEIMLNENDAYSFCFALLNKLIEYTGSQLGAVYLLNGTKSTFDKFVGIGFGEEGSKSFSATHFEGEFGASLSTKKIQYITAIQEDTQFTFSTVAGKFKPREILTVPIVIGNETVAVISLATIKLFNVNSLPLLYKIQSMMSARMDGILTWQKVVSFSKQLEIQNNELEVQKNELSFHSSELAEQNIELEMQKRQLDEANKMKTSFLSSMSHELRTPLNSVIALSGVLSRRLKGKIAADEYSYLEVIERNGKQLLLLINDILDLSRIEAGREVVEINRFNICELVHEVFESVEPIAKQKNINISFQVEGILPLIETDYEKTRHILQNIVSNAVKFTEVGSVEIQVSHIEGSISILTSDTGIGIGEDTLPYIFNEFTQADGSNSRKFGGTGLGLAIAKKYADLLGGDITVESIPNSGSKFNLTLPLYYSKSQTGHVLTGPDTWNHLSKPIHIPGFDENSGKTILLVEDNDSIIVQLKDILELQGYRILEAHNGQQALEQIARKIPDAMILDLMMPGVDGFGVLKRIREEKKTEFLPVIILTAKFVTKEELAFLKHNGIHQLIRKGDINKDQLLNEIAAMLQVGSKLAKARPSEEAKPVKSSAPTILVVEDNPDNILTIKALIDDRCLVLEAVDGRKGFEMAVLHRPELILLDIALPEMSGTELLKSLRKEHALRHIPVIAVTSCAMQGDRENFLAFGFDGYLSKPIDRELFEKLIKKYIVA